MDPASANSFYGVFIGFGVSMFIVGLILIAVKDSGFGWGMVVLSGPLFFAGYAGQKMLDRRLKDEEKIPLNYKRIQYGAPLPNAPKQQQQNLYLDDSEGFKKVMNDMGGELSSVGEWAGAILANQTTFARDKAKEYGVSGKVFLPLQSFFDSQGWAVKSDPKVQNSPWIITPTGKAKLGILAAFAPPPPTINE